MGGQRPSGCRAADKRDELAPSHVSYEADDLAPSGRKTSTLRPGCMGAGSRSDTDGHDYTPLRAREAEKRWGLSQSIGGCGLPSRPAVAAASAHSRTTAISSP